MDLEHLSYEERSGFGEWRWGWCDCLFYGRYRQDPNSTL